MKLIRQLHTWLGVFFAPLIILFAFTGALQTFRLQDTKKDGSYTPPAWIVKLADIHTDQRAAHGSDVPRSVPLEWFVAVMAAGLITSSLLGIYMAFRFHRDRRIIIGLLILGCLIPLALLYL